MQTRRFVSELTWFIVNKAIIVIFFYYATSYIKRQTFEKRGFFCDDQSINYPHIEEYIPWKTLKRICTFVPVIVIFVVEIYVDKTRCLMSFILKMAKYIGSFHTGYMINQLSVKTVKRFAGRLRPVFLDVCKPKLNSECKPMEYIRNFECVNPRAESYLRKSFYSGHSCLAMFTAFYLILYIQTRLRPVLRECAIIPILQCSLFLAGLFVGLSRVADYNHHWSDVGAGLFAGMVVATVNHYNWEPVNIEEEDEEESTTLLPTCKNSIQDR